MPFDSLGVPIAKPLSHDVFFHVVQKLVCCYSLSLYKITKQKARSHCCRWIEEAATSHLHLMCRIWNFIGL
ncbi:hypothetical protein ACOSP7_009298 [Xanthoceras sorbifolium]